MLFRSKTPTDSMTGVVVGNHTSLNENNLNFFAGQKKNKLGYTLFLGGNQKEAVDINKDGFMEVPKDRNYIIHPRLFYENKNLKINAGYNFNYDHRESGLINALTNGLTATNNFHVIEKYIRHTADLTLDYKLNDQSSIHYKSAVSFYSRNYSNPDILFNGNENNSYQEMNIVSVKGKHTTVAGINFITSNFTHASNDSLPFGNFNTNTIGKIGRAHV